LTTRARDVDFLVVDLETTGLNPRRDHVLAVGWVPVTGGEVVLAGAHEVVVRPSSGDPVGDSATVHGLTDDAVARAPTLTDVLPELLAALHGRVLVAHHVPIEVGFLDRATRAAYDAPFSVTVVDTLALQQRLVGGLHSQGPPASLRLDPARRHFGLPRYRAHRALTDAVATAELLLAQVAELGVRLGRPATLGDLSRT
jgi:DNA polymerase-3 subunit epsilon